LRAESKCRTSSEQGPILGRHRRGAASPNTRGAGSAVEAGSVSVQSETGASVAATEPAAPNQLTRKLTATRQAQPPGREEELALLERWRRDGDRAARDRLLTADLRAVAAIAYRYRHYGVPLDELIAVGNIALLNALSGRGARFMTYAAFWVRAHVLNAVVESFSMVGAGSGAPRTKMFFKLRRERARGRVLLDVPVTNSAHRRRHCPGRHRLLQER
jgi:DNA-directed RNA polymerase sigma subunit (sigma70/sigma32)